MSTGTLFNRKVQVSVGPRGKPVLLIEGLRITFKIEKTLEKTPNNSIIEIYNLAPSTRAAFEEKNAAIRVTAGYGTQTKDLFIGDIASVITKKTGADIITSVEAQDGLLAYRNTEADLSFAAGANVGTVFDQVVSAFGVPKGEIVGMNRADTFLNGLALSGKVQEHMDTVLGKQNLTWSIQDEQIQVLAHGKGSTRKAVFLSPKTGLLASPFKRAVVNANIAKKVEGKEAENGSIFKSLLNPEISPGRFVEIEARFLSGIFRVEKVTHSGDTHGNTFFTDGEGTLIVGAVTAMQAAQASISGLGNVLA